MTEIANRAITGYITLRDAVHQARSERGMTIKALAAKARISDSCLDTLLSSDCRGHKSMQEETADSIADALGMHTADIEWPLPFSTAGGQAHAHPQTNKLPVVTRPLCPAHNVELSLSGECFLC